MGLWDVAIDQLLRDEETLWLDGADVVHTTSWCAPSAAPVVDCWRLVYVGDAIDRRYRACRLCRRRTA